MGWTLNGHGGLDWWVDQVGERLEQKSSHYLLLQLDLDRPLCMVAFPPAADRADQYTVQSHIFYVSQYLIA